MNPIRNILAIVDPTARQHPAVVKGALLAEQLHARLDLFACDTRAARNLRLADYVRDSSQAPFTTDLTSVLESLAQPLRERGLDVTTQWTSADPLHTALLERVKHTCAELVIKDTHHHTLARRTFLTNTDWELIRGCPVALLLTKATPWSSKFRVCAALDPGHRDDQPMLLDRCILDHASTLAQHLEGELHAMHAFIPVAIATAAATAISVPPVLVDISPVVLANERESKLRELCALTSDYRVRPERIHLEAGGVDEVLERLARQLKVDIMVMGAVSRSAMKRVFIGSTAERVLENIPCDLLVVKTPNFAELLPM
jgi:universal stress protein E